MSEVCGPRTCHEQLGYAKKHKPYDTEQLTAITEPSWSLLSLQTLPELSCSCRWLFMRGGKLPFLDLHQAGPKDAAEMLHTSVTWMAERSLTLRKSVASGTLSPGSPLENKCAWTRQTDRVLIIACIVGKSI